MADDLTAREERIRARAHQLWLNAGTPIGRDNEFWHEAEAQIALEDKDPTPDPLPSRSGLPHT